MLLEKKPKLIVILGPTVSGKTSLSIKIARRFNVEIINADSRTVYKGMNIGTSKPTATELKKARHHLFSIVKPDERFTLADWQKLAFKTIDEILQKGKVPILSGGTGLYISSIIENYRIPQKKGKSKYDVLIIGIHTETQLLYKRINKRVLEMIKHGLEKEVTRLKNKYSWELSSMHGIGYREWKPFFEGKKTMDEVIADIQQATRNYAKRQMTWFRRMERKKQRIHWIRSSSEANILIKKFLQF